MKQALSFRLFVSLTGILLLPTMAVAQSITPTTSPAGTPATTIAPELQEAVVEYFSERNQCLSEYQFGSVLFDIPANSEQTVRAGQTLTINATLENTNPYPLTEGRVYAHVLRQDSTVAPTNWHPLVYEGDVLGDFSIGANQKKPVTFTWQVPAQSPSGIYRVELYYLAGKRFVMAGLPYTPNVAGASSLFFVNQPATSVSYLEFDRGSVELQNEPLELRSVPPVLQPNTPVTASVDLAAIGTASTTPTTVKASLYRWSNIDNQPAVQETTVTVTPTATTPASIPFTWNTPEGGAYELVFEALNAPVGQLPTRLKFRFAVAGTEPRIIFSGVTGVEGDNVKVTTCAVNSTFSEGQGTLATSVLGSDGQTLATNNGAAQGDGLASNVLFVSKEAAAAGLQVTAQAKDEQGNLSDSLTTTYSSTLLASLIPTPTPVPTTDSFTLSTRTMAIAAGIVVLILLALGIYAWRQRANRNTLPPTSTLNPPNPPRL